MAEKKRGLFDTIISPFVNVEREPEAPAPPPATPAPFAAPPSALPPAPFMGSPASPSVPFASPPFAVAEEPQLSFEEMGVIAAEVNGILGVDSLPALQAFREAHETLAAGGSMTKDEQIKMAIMIVLRMKAFEPQKMFADARAAYGKLDAYMTTTRSSMPAELQAIATQADNRAQELDQQLADVQRQIEQLQARHRELTAERDQLATKAEQERLRCQLRHQVRASQLQSQAVLLQQISAITQDMLTKSASRRTS